MSQFVRQAVHRHHVRRVARAGHRLRDRWLPGLALDAAEFAHDLQRRATGKSRHTSARRETDEVEILSGVYEGLTTGTPIALLIRNTDQRSKDYANIGQQFRPGHADYSYWHKYGIRDPRGGTFLGARNHHARSRRGGRQEVAGRASA